MSLEGVEEENVASKFEDWTCDVKIHNVGGKHYRFSIKKLHKVIDPDACRVIIKPKRIIISLRKLEEEDWKDLHFKEDKVFLFYFKSIAPQICLGMYSVEHMFNSSFCYVSVIFKFLQSSLKRSLRRSPWPNYWR